MKISLAIGLLGILMMSMTAGCTSSAASFDSQLTSIVKPYRFSIAAWELRAIPAKIKQWLFGPREPAGDDARTVIDYFSQVEKAQTLNFQLEAAQGSGRSGDAEALQAESARIENQHQATHKAVEQIIANQIRATLAEQGIFNPVDGTGLRFSFPPISFELGKPPRVLIISPREKIENMKEITLHQDLSLEQAEDIEKKVDSLAVSSLVVEPGGFGGTYPTFVINNAGLRFTIDTATHEWLHQYLAFKPLGFRYVLDLTGISKNYDIVGMNETLASMVSKEIGAMVYNKYYANLTGGRKTPVLQGFDFNKEMREIRQQVDRLLAEGKIEPAEQFMQQKREYLASNGYHIRKLNQAYFAFHGSYADHPTSVSPIGAELRKLRGNSASLKDFLAKAETMTSRQDLINAVK